MKLIGFFGLLTTMQLSYAQVNITDGLIANYPLDGNVRDTSGNGNHGTIIGNVKPTTDRWGKPNSAYSFDGNASYINITDVNGFPQLSNPASNYTICAWFNSYDSLKIIFADNSDDGWITLQPTGFYLLQGYWHSLGLSHNLGCDSIKWHFIAGVVDYPVMKLFYDGSIVATTSLTEELLSFSLNGVSIGSDKDTRHFRGKIDDIRVYNRSLNVDELKALYNIKHILDTTTYYVSSPGFESISPKIYLNNIDTLPSHDMVFHYLKYEYNPVCTDTVKITVEDTLRFSVNLTAINPPLNKVNVKIYPNPSKDYLNVVFYNYSQMNGYHINITNINGIMVFNSIIDKQLFNINLRTWTGTGVYIVKITDNTGKILTTKTIILE